ncbi:hypothetical protein Acr_00g0043570 [Actinidia rufa]|uniref:Uncharacterized protein n=1 Tax=Actinidia rufa TaxID=165716 RepID=A0A7J0DIU9_9ERIC|nr:hypothetical protein Acr_00g0043570 [Actinidia rufa]
MSYKVTVKLKNLLLSWISIHLEDCSFMKIEVKDYLPLPKEEDLAKLVEDLPVVEDARPPPKKETSIMAEDEIDHLGELCSFLVGIQMRLPKARDDCEFAHRQSWELRVLRVLRSWNTQDIRSFSVQGEDVSKGLEVKLANSPFHTLSRYALPRPIGGEEGTLVNLGVVIGLEALVVKSPIVAEMLAQAFVLLADKKMEKDEVATQFYHAFSQECSNAALLRLEKDVADLKKDKENFDDAMKKFKKEVA